MMRTPGKSVSEQAMLAEWTEIQQAQRQPAAFRVLYERYYEPIFRFILRRTASEPLTADLCQQVFLKALQKLGGYQYRGVPFSAWLYRIATNEVTQHFRDAGRNRTVSVDDRTLHDLADTVNEEAARFTVEQMIAELPNLREQDVQILELRFFEQRPFAEVAQILGITESNAKVRTYRVLERLKKRLEATAANPNR